VSRKINLCVLFGGQSPEHEVSVMSADSILGAVDNDKYSVEPVWIDREGRWFKGIRPKDLPDNKSAGEPVIDIIGELKKYDAAFPALHGRFGEDGTVQGIFEIAQVPYVGADVLGSALAIDKAVTKAVCSAHGIKVVDFIEVSFDQWKHDSAVVEKQLASKIDFPCFVKPCCGGSSIGTSKVEDGKNLKEAIAAAFVHEKRILVEKAVDGREIECGILGNDVPEASVCGEIRTLNDFYDYQAKYTDGLSEIMIPADIPEKTSDRIRSIALEAFKALRCRGMARADFFLDKATGEIYFSELNTIPGFTRFSMYPLLWQACGLKYPDLIDRLVQLALEASTKDQQREEPAPANKRISEKEYAV